MTVADLIRELQAMPNQHAPVRVIQRGIWHQGFAGQWERAEQIVGVDDSIADNVRHEGSFVLVEGP